MPVLTRLDRAEWRSIHTRILLALGIGWALDSFEVQIIGSVIKPLAKEFDLLGADGAVEPWALSTIWVVWFVGLIMGASGFGWLADRFGRKKLFVATLVVYSIATIATAFAPNFAIFLIFRFITALGVGGEYSAVTSTITEFVPVRRRGAAVAATMNFWAIGGIISGLVGIFFLNSFVASRLAVGGVDLAAWRLCLLAGALAAGYALIARRVIPESPRWLAAQGRHDEANAIITSMSGLPDDGSDVVGTPNRRGFWAQAGALWSDWRGRLVYGSALEFSAGAAYYGLFTFLSAYILIDGRVEVEASTVPFFYLIGNVGALAGGFTVASLIDRIGRRNTVLLAYSLAVTATILLSFATASRSPGWTMAAFTLCTFSATCCWISTYTTFAELFPTELRATGVGICVSVGRVGAMFSVVGLAYIVDGLGAFPAFSLLAGFCAIGVLVSLIWRSRVREATGLSLDEVSPATAAAPA